MSPVVRAIGPMNHTWSMHGMINAKLSTLAAIAGMPDGSIDGVFHVVMS